MKKLRITINGNAYDVEVEVLGEVSKASAPVAAAPVSAPVATPVAAPVAAPKPAVAAGANTVTAQLAAVVVSVDVKPGQQVKEGDKLITLEAMKMNTLVFAPTAGTVGEIHVSAGQSVAEGDALVTLA